MNLSTNTLPVKIHFPPPITTDLPTILGFKQPKVLSMQTIIHLHLRQIIHLHGLELQENSHCSLVTLCTSCFRPRKLRMIESFKAEGLFFVATYFLKMLIWVLMLFLVFGHHMFGYLVVFVP